MRFQVAGKPSRWSRRQPAIAIVAVLSLFAAALGCWALHAEIAADTLHSAQASVSAPNIGPVGHQGGSAPACHFDLGPTLSDDKAFKSGGLKRDRSPTFPLTVPRSLWAIPAIRSGARWQQWNHANSRAAVTVLAGQDLLTQLCIARC